MDEWYQFLPAVTYKYLDAEQAEEHFKEMDKIVNQLAFKAQIQKQLADEEEKQQKATMMMVSFIFFKLNIIKKF